MWSCTPGTQQAGARPARTSTYDTQHVDRLSVKHLSADRGCVLPMATGQTYLTRWRQCGAAPDTHVHPSTATLGAGAGEPGPGDIARVRPQPRELHAPGMHTRATTSTRRTGQGRSRRRACQWAWTSRGSTAPRDPTRPHRPSRPAGSRGARVTCTQRSPSRVPRLPTSMSTPKRCVASPNKPSMTRSSGK